MPAAKTGASRERKEEMMARFQQWWSFRAPVPRARRAATPGYLPEADGRARRILACGHGARLAVLIAVAVGAAAGARAGSADGTAAPSPPDPAGSSASSGSPAATTTVQLQPSTLSFGFQPVGSASGPRAVVITNSGSAPLAIGAATMAGDGVGDFSIPTDLAGSTVDPGQSHSIGIQFIPTARGARSATLTIVDNAAGSPHLIPLIGVGVAADGSDGGFTILDLGTLGGANSEANAINNLGQVVGMSDVPGGPDAFLYDSAGVHDLGTLGGPGSVAHSINDAGQVVGNSYIPQTATRGPENHAFLYDSTGMHDLNTLAGVHDSTAWAINASGQVVGDTHSPGMAFIAVAGVMRDLGISGEPRGINDLGHVVGRAYFSGAPWLDPFFFDGIQMHDLGNFGGNGGFAYAINAADQVVGYAATVATVHAFLYDSAGMHDLGMLGGPLGYSSYALGINNAGQVVGYTNITGSNSRAFFWDKGRMQDLNDLIPAGSGWEIREARGINDRGQIAAVGKIASGTPDALTHALLLSPTAVLPVVSPQAPSALSVKLPTPPVFSELQLAWTDNSNNETGFEIQRKAPGSDWATVAVTLPDSTTYLDTNLAPFVHYTYRVRAINTAGVSDWTNEASGDTGVRPASSGWTGLSFGGQPVGTPSQPQTLTVTNTGNGPLTIGTVALSGANAADFQITSPSCAGATIAPDGTCAITVVFTPSATGDRTATLTVTDNAPGSPHVVALTGAGTAPALKLSPAALDFGSQPVDLTGDLALLLENSGGAPLQVNSLAFQGPNASEFTLAPGSWSGGVLQPGDIVLLNVRFSPTVTGSRSASLVITDDAANSPQSVALTGFGTAPLLQLSADSLIFGLQAGNSTQTLTLSNSGDAALTITGLNLTGPDAGHFQVVSDTGEQSLPVGGSRTVQIAFQSATVASAPRHARIAAVSYYATLEIRDNDPHPTTPHIVSLIATSGGGSAANTAPSPSGVAPASPPVAPTGLAARAPSASQVDLTWSDNSSNEQALAIWRSGGGQDWARVGIMGPHATTYADTTVQPGVSYTYKVRAVNGGGASNWSNTVSLTPGAPPAAPTGLTASPATGNGVTLTWSSNSSDEQAFAIWRSGGGADWARVGIAGPGTTSYTDTGATPNTAYSYQVRAINRFGASDWSNTVSVTPGASVPAAPAGLAATVTSAQVTLTWTNQGTDQHALAIWRTGGGQDWARVGIVGAHATSYTDATVSPNTAYSYKVRAVNGSGASDWSNVVALTTGAAPPAAPTGLAASVTGGQVTLTWTSQSTDEHAFAIWRTGGGQEWARVGIVGAQTTSYADSGLTPGTSYTYRVRAIGAGGASGWSNAVSVQVPAAP